MNGSIDLDTDTIKLMLVTSTYVQNVDTHAKRSDITNKQNSQSNLNIKYEQRAI